MTMFFPSTYPSSRSPCRNASLRPESWPPPVKNPIPKIFVGCCADAGTQSEKSRALSPMPITFFPTVFLQRLDSAVRPLPSALALSLDHLIRPCQYIRRNRQADLLRRFQIDDELELLRLLHRQLGGFGSFENFVYISSCATVQVGQVHTVGHKP